MENKDEDVLGAVIVYRDIDGDHIGGPDCWCCPYILRTEEDFRRFEQISDRPEKQVS